MKVPRAPVVVDPAMVRDISTLTILNLKIFDVRFERFQYS